MHLWAQPPSHQVLMRLLYTATVSRVADGVGLDLDHSSSAGLSPKCANSCAARLAVLVAGTPPRTLSQQTSLAVGWGLQLCLKFRARPSDGLENKYSAQPLLDR